MACRRSSVRSRSGPPDLINRRFKRRLFFGGHEGFYFICPQESRVWVEYKFLPYILSSLESFCFLTMLVLSGKINYISVFEERK